MPDDAPNGGLPRAIGRIEGQLDSLQVQFREVREEMRQSRQASSSEIATVGIRLGKVEIALGLKSGEDAAERIADQKQHTWRQTIITSIAATIAGAVGALATLLAAHK